MSQNRASPSDTTETTDVRNVVRGIRKPPHIDLWQALHKLEPAEVDCHQGTLFHRGENCHGVYMVEEGRVKLLLSPEAVVVQDFEVVGSGAVLGLAEAITGGKYCLTAEAGEDARITCIERQSLLKHLSQDQQLCLQIVHLLSEDLHCLYHRVRGTAVATSSSAKRDSSGVH